MRYFLLNANEVVVHKFDADSDSKALPTLRDWCLKNRAEYSLCTVLMHGAVQITPATVRVIEEARR